MLYIIATPIGHLDDITLRAIHILKIVDCILAEDTRHTKQLLQYYQINTPLLTLHEHNELEKTDSIIKQLQTGKTFALVSDAGTPLISDPGYILVSQAKQNNIQVSPVPGVSAVIAALSVSGLPTDYWTFMGFLPSKAAARLKTLQNIKYKQENTIFYESPKRIFATLTTMKSIFGTKRLVCLAKELTKHFETIITKPIDEILLWLEADNKRQQGEFVLIVSGAPKIQTSEKMLELARISPILLAEMNTSKAAKVAAKLTELDKKTCYNYLLTQ